MMFEAVFKIFLEFVFFRKEIRTHGGSVAERRVGISNSYVIGLQTKQSPHAIPSHWDEVNPLQQTRTINRPSRTRCDGKQ